jgi:Domain of unknown function (DUF3943)
MRPSRSGELRRTLLSGLLVLTLTSPSAVAAQASPAAPAPSSGRVLNWDTGEGKSWLVPGLEVPAFILALNLFNRLFIDSDEYGSDFDTIWDNLTGSAVIDKDPFSVNQIGHPYQGGIYYGLARSAGLNYWQSSLYTLAGSVLWETAGETTPASLNDHITTGVGGTFVGEALFRMASLLLEGGGETPGFWRELGAAVISPPLGLNRLVFGDRFDAVFPSRDPAVFIRLRIGGTLTTDVTNAGLSGGEFKRQEVGADYSMIYGLPGKPGYQYTRPFDYFQFELAVVPNASSVANAFENVTIRGLLAGQKYELGDDYRGVWGIFGSYEYLSPQIFRLSATSLGLGTVAQWWLTRSVALQSSVLGNVGFGAAGSVTDRAERDYHYGLTASVVIGLRLIFGERAMLEASGRQYYVGGSGSGADVSTDAFSGETIARGNVGITVRVYGPHAIGLHYLASNRDARFFGQRDRRQSVETVSLSYNFLGHSRFGAVEWRD